MKRILAVYDVDPFYAERLAGYANRRESVPFAVIAFSSVERLMNYSKEHEVELLLINSEVDETELSLINTGQIITLNEGELRAGRSGEPTVYKYQSADNILREVMACYQVEADGEMVCADGRSCFMAGVYSPVSRCGKTSFSLAYAQMAARENRTLYVNLEDCSGFTGLLAREGDGGGLSDLLYYFKHYILDRIKLSSVTYSIGELDYIPPVRYPEDLCETNARELVRLLRHVSGIGNYQTMVVDLGVMGKLAADILSACDAVYMPTLEDAVSQAKIGEFEHYLELSGRDALKEKLQKLALPPLTILPGGGSWTEQLLWGELGDYTRTLLRGRPEGWRN